MHIIKNNVLPILILIILLRLVKLDSVPPGFANDEAAITYQAYSILKTGNDTWGAKLPILSFKDFGEHLPPMAVYIQVPFLYIFGLNEFAARLPFALSSILAIIPLYILTKYLFNKKEIAHIACFLFAISPLDIGWSRFVYEGNFGMLFYLTGMMFYVLSIKKPIYLTPSLIFFGLTLTTYHIYYFVTPLTISALFLPRLMPLFKKNKQLILRLFLIGLIIGAYYLLIVASGSGRERFRQVSIFNKDSIIDDLNIKRSECQIKLPSIVCKLFYNKGTAFFREYSFNYLSHFSPTFLAINGTFLRGTILPIHGLIYPFELPFFFLGIIYIGIKRNFASYVLFVWLLLYPAANSFTGLGEISRITHATPLFPIISSLEIYNTYIALQKLKQFKIIFTVFIIIAVFSVASFMINYFYVFPISNSKNGSYAYVQLFKKIALQRKSESNYFITRDYTGNTPEFQARIFLPLDPVAFQDKSRNEYILKKPENYVDYRRIDNFYFGNFQDNKATKDDLLVIPPHELIDSDEIMFEIREPSGEISLYVIKRNLDEN